MQQRTRLPALLVCIIISVLILGIYLRFQFLDAKAYWEDETFTSLRVAGYTRQELIDANFSGDVIDVEDLKRFQSLNPDKTILDTAKSLADDVHPPLYFLLLRIWATLFGDSTTAFRSFSVVAGILLWPCMWLLAKELFNSPEIGYLAIGLNAVSPFYIGISHEARMYTLWAVFATLSYTFLLKSIRSNTYKHWIPYAITTLAALYTHWFSLLLIGGQGLYLLLRNQFSLKRVSKKAFYVLTAVAIGFLPWPIFVGRRLTNLHSQTTWTGADISLIGESSLLERWLSNLSYTFINDYVAYTTTQTYNLSWSPIWWRLPFVVLLVFAIYACLRHTSSKVWSLLLLITLSSYLPLAIADILLGGYRSAVLRYLAPSLIGVELLVAYLLLAPKRDMISTAQRQRPRLFQGFAAALLITGGLTQTLFQFSFNRSQQPLVALSELLNQRPQPLLISDIRPTQLLPLAHELLPHVSMQFVTHKHGFTMPESSADDFSDIFLYHPSKRIQTQLTQEGYALEPVAGIAGLLRVTNR